MVEEILFGDIATGILIALALGIGGVIMGFFRKISKTQADLCTKVTNLEKALIILSSALDRQTNMLHPEKNPNSDLDDLVSKILDD